MEKLQRQVRSTGLGVGVGHDCRAGGGDAGLGARQEGSGRKLQGSGAGTAGLWAGTQSWGRERRARAGVLGGPGAAAWKVLAA